MPIITLQVDPAQSAPKYSVVGEYLFDTASSFVRHVAILRENTELQYAQRDVQVWHSGPPIVTGVQSAAAVDELALSCTVHLLGVLDLQPDEIEGIETWLADLDTETRPSAFLQYVVHPSMVWKLAENGTRLYRRFSCVGFVLECYRSVQINLIDDLNGENLPPIDLEHVAQAYGPHVRREVLRECVGIPGNGPWHIVLAGYVIHALNRPSEAIREAPYQPASIAERNFPIDAPAPPSTSG